MSVHTDVPAGDIQRFADEVRRELYAPITRQGMEGDLLAQLERASRQIETEWVRLPGPDARFEPGDLVGVLGTRDQRAAFVALT